MDFYKKTLFTVLIIIFTFAIMVKLVEPVIERQITNLFADKKLSKKLTKELLNSTKDFTPEKREFYKSILKKIYVKWKPLITEVQEESELEINK